MFFSFTHSIELVAGNRLEPRSELEISTVREIDIERPAATTSTICERSVGPTKLHDLLLIMPMPTSTYSCSSLYVGGLPRAETGEGTPTSSRISTSSDKLPPSVSLL